MPEQEPPENEQTEPATTEGQQAPGGGTRKPKRHALYNYDQWNAVYLAWRAGDKRNIDLARQFGIDSDTISAWVRKGTPSRRRPSFLERARTSNDGVDEKEIVHEAKAQAAAKMANEIVDEYGQVRREQLEVLRVVRKVAGQQIVEATRHLKEIAWTKRGPGGSSRPLDATEYAEVLRVLTASVATAGKMESFWLGGPRPVEEDSIPEELQFSETERAYIEEHGETPPGMSIEEMARKVAAAGGSVPLRVVK